MFCCCTRNLTLAIPSLDSLAFRPHAAFILPPPTISICPPGSPQSLTKMVSRIRFQGKCLLQGKPRASEDTPTRRALCTLWNLSLHSNPLMPPRPIYLRGTK